MLESLKRELRDANESLVKLGLVHNSTTFGNVSSLDESRNYVAIKPSGIKCENMNYEHIVILNLKGDIIEGEKKPSSDTNTHLEIYRNFPEINAIVHTHSSHAVSFAQAKIPITCLGTTHADYFHGSIPVIRELTKKEVCKDYELNIGKAIVETFKNLRINHLEISACLLHSHGPFIWAKNLEEALEKAFILEEIAKINFMTLRLNPSIEPLNSYLMDKHFLRKNGPNAYYGQK
jgi:L-ribulose-5-phosphate 4-epimerase